MLRRSSSIARPENGGRPISSENRTAPSPNMSVRASIAPHAGSSCPSDSLREGDQMLYIDAETCIDCACVPECPVEAIFYEENVPEQWREYVALNAEMAPKCPPITERKTPLA